MKRYLVVCFSILMGLSIRQGHAQIGYRPKSVAPMKTYTKVSYTPFKSASFGGGLPDNPFEPGTGGLPIDPGGGYDPDDIFGGGSLPVNPIEPQPLPTPVGNIPYLLLTACIGLYLSRKTLRQS